MKKADFILIFIFIILSFLSGFLFKLYSKTGSRVFIYVDKELRGEYKISDDKEINIKGKNGYSCSLVISNKKVYVKNANCPDKLCMSHGTISKTNESIICLPARIVITIESNEEAGYDSISG